MNTQLATKDDRPPIVVLRDRLEQRKPELKAALTDISPEQFIRAVITSATINPDIQACSWQSVWLACMRACRDGLLPDGVEGAIVPFKSTAQWIPMYQGLLRRFRRSGQFKWVTAGIVRSGEEFSHWIDQDGEHFRHVPGDNVEAGIVKIYALATTIEGGVFCAVIPIAEANKMRNMSRATREDSPWKQWPEEMYKKTALRRLSKMLPSARDIIGDEEIEAPSTQQVLGGRLQPATVGERLDQFANVASTSGSVDRNAKPSDAPEAPTASEHGDGEQVATPSTAEVPAAADHDVESFGPIDDDDDGKAREAYEAGKAAKAIGQRRTSCPGEYRDLAKLSAAWIAGYNGDPPPMV